MKKIIVLAILCLAISACTAAGVTPVDGAAGFWTGLWHGMIVVITFVMSLFRDDVGIYETVNNGWPYNLGFVVGMVIPVSIFNN